MGWIKYKLWMRLIVLYGTKKKISTDMFKLTNIIKIGPYIFHSSRMNLWMDFLPFTYYGNWFLQFVMICCRWIHFFFLSSGNVEFNIFFCPKNYSEREAKLCPLKYSWQLHRICCTTSFIVYLYISRVLYSV